MHFLPVGWNGLSVNTLEGVEQTSQIPPKKCKWTFLENLYRDCSIALRSENASRSNTAPTLGWIPLWLLVTNHHWKLSRSYCSTVCVTWMLLDKPFLSHLCVRIVWGSHYPHSSSSPALGHWSFLGSEILTLYETPATCVSTASEVLISSGVLHSLLAIKQLLAPLFSQKLYCILHKYQSLQQAWVLQNWECLLILMHSFSGPREWSGRLSKMH